MSHPSETPAARPNGVRTLLVGSQPCPVCGKVSLTGRQTARSAACRRERSRWRQVQALREAVMTLGTQVVHLSNLVEKLHGERRRRKRYAVTDPEGQRRAP